MRITSRSLGSVCMCVKKFGLTIINVVGNNNTIINNQLLTLTQRSGQWILYTMASAIEHRDCRFYAEGEPESEYLIWREARGSSAGDRVWAVW